VEPLDSPEPTELPETPDLHGAYPRLSDAQVDMLAAQGERRPTKAGDVLFREGDKEYDFFVVLAGKVAMVEDDEPGQRLIAVHGHGRFLGELSLLSGQAAPYTAVVREPGEVLRVPVGRLREMAVANPALGDLLLRAYLMRRSILIGLGAGFRILGSRYSPDTRRLREFAARNRLPHRWLDLEDDPAAEVLLRELGVAPQETPVVVWGGGNLLRNPSLAELARALGLPAPRADDVVCDLIVVGAGPSGLAASVYGASEGLATVTLDGVAPGGQAGTSSRIENYLGFPAGVSGGELAERATLQAERFGARLAVPAEAAALEERDGHYDVTLDDGTTFSGRTVVIATGARYRKLPVPRLEEFEPNSVYYAATEVEAQFCRDDPVTIVGGGNSAGQATVFLAQHAAQVNLVVREDALTENMSRYLADRIARLPRVRVLLHTDVRELVGEETLEAVVVQDRRTGERETLPSRALFVFIGAQPHTRWLGDEVALDEHGYILTGPEARGAAAGDPRWDIGRDPFLLETSRPGIFAVGDVRSGSIKRVASAVGEGAMAVRLIHEHLGGRHSATVAGPGAQAQT
jgi:thioredoxin reductase (NADPH)